jgi:hypothetical protein
VSKWNQRAIDTLNHDCPSCGMPAGTVCFTDRGRPRRVFCKERTPNGRATVYATEAEPLFSLDEEEPGDA